MSDSGGASGIQQELVQKRPFHSIRAEVAVSILRTAALIERHFAQVVRGEAKPRADAADGVRVIRVLDAASRSLAAGGAPVTLEGRA